jgi:serine/threonine protein kinase/tetratricopeptide (TPR) repeat protein
VQPKIIEHIFWDAAQIASADKRDAYLARACSEDAEMRRRVEQLLRARAMSGSFLECPPPPLAATAEYRPLREGPGAVIGPYKLLEQIGEGGFGVVFMAEQQRPVSRKVALKILKPGMDSRQVVARFEAERQALALMDHPNIARIFDAGQADSGLPYFVMELVKGVAITDFCDRGNLAVPERLRLFIAACQAVQHAHQKGIIHRDIKPSNVLVTLHDGTPVVKVIDFGIAKAIGQRLTDKTLVTGFAQMIGTPLYMSPEQAALSGLDVDTRSDVYALGVLLYELLTGTPPFDEERLRGAGFDEVRRIIREEEPPRPSARISTLGQAATLVSASRRSDPARLGQLCRGELDWIVMKALEKDRNRRYETVSDLAADVHRHLRHELVQACPPSALYRLRTLARKHRARLGVAAALLLSLLVAGGGAAWAMRDRAARAAAAEAEVRRALDEAATLLSHGKWPEALAAARRAEGLLAGGGDARLRNRVDEMKKDVEMVLRLERLRFPDASGPAEGAYDEAAADARIAQAFREYGIDVEALDPVEAGRRVRSRPIRLELAMALDHWVKVRTPIPEATRKATGKIRKRLREAARAADPDAWRNQLRDALIDRRPEVLVRLAAKAKIDRLPLQSLSLMGWALETAGASEQATAILRQAQRKYPDDFWINFQLAWCLDHRRHAGPAQKEEAIRFYTVARALRPRNVPAHLFLGRALGGRGHFEEAAAVYRTAAELDPDEAGHHYCLALAQLATGDEAGYRKTCAALLDRFAQAEKPEAANWAAWTSVLRQDALSDPEGAVALAEAALRGEPSSVKYANTLGAALYRAGRLDEAVRRLNEAQAGLQKAAQKPPPYSPAYTSFFLAMAHHRMGRPGEARRWLERGTRRMEEEVRDERLWWNRRVTLQSLRREAESLLRGGKD